MGLERAPPAALSRTLWATCSDAKLCQALYLRLFFHFKNLYDGRHANRLKFEKRYDDICAEWLGALTVHSKKSLIEREQLGRHLRDLVRAGFLASYAIEKVSARAASGDGFKLVFRPGPAFFADYDRFYRHRSQGDLQFDFHGEQQALVEPLKVAYSFLEKRTGRPLKLIPYVSSKDVETAKTLLQSISFDQISAFLDYGLAEARKTNFDVQSLGGLKQYLAGYLYSRQRRAAISDATKAVTQQRAADAALEIGYIAFRRTRAKAVFAGLPADERSAIEALAKGGNAVFDRKPGSLGAMMLDLAIVRITAERHPEKIPTFEAWRSTQKPR